MQIQKSDKYFIISFQYRPNLVEAVKLLPGKRWDGVNKVWLVPIEFENAVTRFGEAYGFKFGKQIVTSEDIAYTIDPLPELTINLKLVFSKQYTSIYFQNLGLAITKQLT